MSTFTCGFKKGVLKGFSPPHVDGKLDWLTISQCAVDCCLSACSRNTPVVVLFGIDAV
jgi:hypothetical protein